MESLHDIVDDQQELLRNWRDLKEAQDKILIEQGKMLNTLKNLTETVHALKDTQAEPFL